MLYIKRNLNFVYHVCSLVIAVKIMTVGSYNVLDMQLRQRSLKRQGDSW
jgi:hypothetical protein